MLLHIAFIFSFINLFSIFNFYVLIFFLWKKAASKMLALKDAASLWHTNLKPPAFFLRGLMTILAALGCVAVHKNFQAENFFLRPTQDGHDLYGVMLNFVAQLKELASMFWRSNPFGFEWCRMK